VQPGRCLIGVLCDGCGRPGCGMNDEVNEIGNGGLLVIGCGVSDD